MIAMAVRDQSFRLWPRRIDPSVGRRDVNAFGERLHPGTETRHGGYMAVPPPLSESPKSAPPFQGRGLRGGCARPRAHKDSMRREKRTAGIEPALRSPTPYPSLEREGF